MLKLIQRNEAFYGGSKDLKKKLPFACPLCGRKTDYPLRELVEGTVLTCPFCKLILTLHGHMWKDVQMEIQKLKEKGGGGDGV